MHSFSKLAAEELAEKFNLLTINSDGVEEKLRKARERKDADSIRIYEIELAKLAKGDARLRHKKTLY